MTPGAPAKYLVVILHDSVDAFDTYEEAAEFYQAHIGRAPNSTYLTLVVAGPGNPLLSSEDPHCRPDVVAMRLAPTAACCTDADCDLSGGYAHVGPCEACGCKFHHAVAECDHAVAHSR